MHLAIDAGRHAVKVIGTDYSDWFPSWIGEARSLRLQNKLRQTDIIIKTPTASYFVGDLAKDESHGGARIMTGSKLHTDTKLLILAAVARAVPDGEEVTLTTGVPVEYHTPQIKQEFANMLIGPYVLEVNGQTKRFHIKKVRVAVEGPAAYVVLAEKKPGTIRFLDLGSRTVNYGTIRNGRYVDRESGTLDYGCDTSPSITRRIIGDMSRIWSDFSAETYLIGGGAHQHSDELIYHFPNAVVPEEPEWMNAKAFFAIGERADEMGQ